ncbi:MAG: hydroxymethylbilane synthase [Candidatus Desulfofervidaceae bacterium]|nr:hydroxymethylbilane synthase [Candidatus Desulfofervidaceae bacterium]
MSLKTVRIGTRGSALALKQTNWVASQLKTIYPGIEVEITIIKTQGDKILDVPLAKVGGKGLFVKEIEEALQKEEIDLAVHSLKDVPTVLPEGLCLGAITEREDPRDALITKNNISFSQLPPDARIGTSSLRRQAQLLHYNPQFSILPLRGNVDTRLRKMKEQNLDAIILASAGLKRMNMADKISEYLSPDIILPAIGQGALGIEIREDKKWLDFIAPLNHLPTALATKSERAFLARLEGGCQVPIAAYAVYREDQIEITGLVADVEGKRFFKETLKGAAEAAEDLGQKLAEILLKQGAKEVLAEIYANNS